MSKAREEIGYDHVKRPHPEDSKLVMDRLEKNKRDRRVSPILQDWVDRHGIVLPGVERW